MVSGHQTENAASQTVPERLAVGRFPDRRRALEQRGALRDLDGLERQIVRAGLGADSGIPVRLCARDCFDRGPS